EEIVTPGALSQAFQNPQVLGEIQNRLGQLVGQSSGYIESLPISVRKRIDYLKNLQDETLAIEQEFRREVLELEKKYHLRQIPLYEKRQKVVKGDYEPTEEDAKREEPTPGVEQDEPKMNGIPEFWLTCLKNVEQIADMITPEDEHCLQNLVDIKFEYLNDNPGFKLDFVFSENEYFTNTVLSKTYYLTDSPDPSYGDVVYDRAEGTEIDWKEGKDLSVTVEVKKQRHKATNKTRTVKKTVPKDTFFSFFTPPAPPAEDEDDEDMDELDEILERDYEIGEFIKDKLVPNAVDWFTGKAIMDYDSEDYDEGNLTHIRGLW
ncbi:hypothetical protein EDD86DRAFT_258822, partial [Gorgonomyces haynaldii]